MKNIRLNIFEHKKRSIPIEKGKYLISEPFLQGPFFDRSIVYIVEHSNEGTLGYIINKPSSLYPDELITDLYNFSGELHIGGPIGETSVNFLHKLGALIPNSRPITKSISWGGDFRALKALINLGIANAESVKFFAGYSSWSAGQLEYEIENNAWIVTELSDIVLYNNNSNHIWEDSMNNMGGIYKTWAAFPKNPAFN